MAKKKTYKLTGLFVLLGFACLGGIIFNYTSQKFLTNDEDVVVMYFEESIKGLSIGSSVVFKGVEVGQVSDIKLLIDLQDGTFKTPVYVRFQENKAVRMIEKQNVSPEEEMNELIEKGLRARLISANYLTGQLMIELVMSPNSPAEFDGDGSYYEIPTEMSSIGVISKDLQEIPLKETMLRFSDLIQKLDERMPEILDNVERVTRDLKQAINDKSTETTKALENFNSTMEDMGKASISIKNLTDYLERHPESILRGKENNQ